MHPTLTSALFIVSSLFLTAGCVTTDPTDSSTLPSDPAGAAGESKFQTLSLDWSIQKADGTPDVCPAAYSSLKVHASAWSKEETSNGDAYEAVFDCAAGHGTIRLQTSGDEVVEPNADGSYPRSGARYITGKFNVTMLVTEPSGQVDYLPTVTQTVDLSKGDAKLSFVVSPNASRRLTQWGLHAKSTLERLSCAAAGVDSVRITSKGTLLPDQSPNPNPTEMTETFPCESEPEHVDCVGCVGAGTSKLLEYGWYTTRIELLSKGEVVGTTEPDDETKTIVVDRQSVRLLQGGGPHKSQVYMGTSFFMSVNTR